ncbi:hypothetical protein K501DRAFT_333678 [Backusella circina FSU 941]|nr:hypothetical protein K501DRAFT_333678 [Backusella circina FSU 941]
MKTMHSHSDLTEVLSRLKIRLALANFKREHGYENYDLSTLETSLFLLKKNNSDNSSSSGNSVSSDRSKKTKQHHRYYPPSKPYTKPTNPAYYYKSHYHFSYKLSAKRSTFIPSTDEDAANLLVMLHHTAA